MNNAIASIGNTTSTLAMFGAGMKSGVNPEFSVSISEAGMAALNRPEGAMQDIMPATGMNETLKAALICMLLS
jgi:hypothetical protein